MEEIESLLLLGALFVGAIVMFLAVVAFLPVIVQLLIGGFYYLAFRKRYPYPGVKKIWARYRLRLAWSHFAGAMWKKRDDEDIIARDFKEELQKYKDKSIYDAIVAKTQREPQKEKESAMWEGWKARERKMTGPLNGRKPFLAWEKPDPALEGKTELLLPKTLFVVSDISSDLPGDNVSRYTSELMMSSPGVLSKSSGFITYSAHSMGHNSGLAKYESPASFEDLPRLISNSEDPEASKYIGMTEDNWRSFVEVPVLQPPIPPYPLLWFGHYRQGPADKDERIAWYVLDIVDGHAFLLSKFCLDCKPWHQRPAEDPPLSEYDLKRLPPVAWQDSSLRAWLNGEFAAKAFSQKELRGIRAQDGTDGRITLPDKEEIKRYLTQDAVRGAKPTPYAVTQGAHVYPYSASAPQYRVHVGNALYWLRDPSKEDVNSAWGSNDGIIHVYWAGSLSIGSSRQDNIAVRPSLWLNLEPAFGKRGARSVIDAWERH